jgi:hypothetical protein
MAAEKISPVILSPPEMLPDDQTEPSESQVLSRTKGNALIRLISDGTASNFQYVAAV